jgi:hypothetical protein
LRENLAADAQTVSTNAPAQVELVTFADDKAIQVSVVDLGITEEHRNIESFEVKVKTEKRPSGVYLLPERTPIEFEYEDGKAVFKTRALDLFDMYRLEY